MIRCERDECSFRSVLRSTLAPMPWETRFNTSWVDRTSTVRAVGTPVWPEPSVT